jgi:alkanesulfonate monooxygenase SsuD/methylene tetrahydromethanopterin reductase-like flavin-dependent oxidoreductase (luciferase family)
MTVDVQLSGATTPWPRLRDAALAAEAAGFGTIWVWDHFSGNLLGGDTMLECFTLLGALAAATSRVALGSLVVNVANRPPAVMLGAAASVQAISAGRLLLGLGAGAGPKSWAAAEQHALGLTIPPRLGDRHARLRATLDLADELWGADRPARFAGFARPDPRPPIVLGVNSRPLAELAGRRADGVNVNLAHPDLRSILAAAAQAREGRDGPWTTSVWAPWADDLLDADGARRRELAELGIDRLVLVLLGPAEPDQLAAAAPCLR